MKYIKLLLHLIIMAPIMLVAQDSDVNLITQTLNDYMDGGTERDAERIASAFHPQAMMKFVGDEGYKEVNAAEFFRKGTKPGPKLERICEISNIDIAGNAAVAKLLLKYSDKVFTDYMTLLKIEGVWKIVNKSFHLDTDI